MIAIEQFNDLGSDKYRVGKLVGRDLHLRIIDWRPVGARPSST
jgi:hypothetical protein